MARLPVPISSQYRSTRIDPACQAIINLYPHADGGYQQFPGTTEVASMSAPVAATGKNVSAQLTFGIDVKFGDSGTKMYVLDFSGSESVYQYTCSTAYTAGTASYASKSLSLTSDDSSPVGMYFRDDGTELFVIGDQNDKLIRYTLSTPWDISTGALAAGDYLVTAETTDGRCYPFFKSDGLKLYIASATDDAIYQYTLSVAWDLTSISYDSKSLSTSANITGPEGIFFNPIGNFLYVTGESSEGVDIYLLSTAWDISTGAYLSTWSGALTTNGLSFSPDGTKMHGLLAIAGDSTVIEFTLNPGYGLITSNAMRGSLKMGALVYILFGTQLVSIDSDYTLTLLGDVAGTQRAIMDTDGTQLVITVGANQYVYTVAAGLVEITDADLGNANSNAYLDSRFYYEVGSKIFASALLDASSVGALDFITAESFTDDISALVGLNQSVVALGPESIEVFYSSGEGNTGLERQFVISEKGTIGCYAWTVNDNVLYWLDEERRLNRMIGQQHETIYVPALGSEFLTYATVSDCVLNAYTFEHENFIEIRFPTAQRSWTYHEPSGQMVRRAGTSGVVDYPVSSYVEAFGLLLGVHESSGQIFSFSDTVYQDDGAAITRTLDTGLIDSEVFGVAGHELIMHALHLTLDASGAGTVDVLISTDLQTFGGSRTVTVANGLNQLELRQWGTFRHCLFRLTTTSAIRIDIVNLACEVEVLHA